MLPLKGLTNRLYGGRVAATNGSRRETRRAHFMVVEMGEERGIQGGVIRNCPLSSSAALEAGLRDRPWNDSDRLSVSEPARTCCVGCVED